MAVTIFFGQILNMSLTASIIILLVMAARLLLKRSPKIYSYALWAVVLFRLLCPISIASELSVLELTHPQVSQSSNISYVSYAPVEEVLIADGDIVPPAQETPIPIQALEPQAETPPSVMEVISWCYLAGAAVMILSSLVSYYRLYRNLVGAVRWKSNIYLADHIPSPFVLGTLFPRIYLPSNIPMAERRYVIAHERHHIRRCDHMIKLLAYVALCLHWFNPLVWAAFLLAGRDMEMSCDEAVIKKLGEHIRADYSASLLRFATHRTIIAGTPLAFGEGDPKGRVMNMAKWRKPKVWVSILCGVVCILILAVCALNPKEAQSLAEMTRTTNEGPTGCAYGELHYTLPGGITHELREIPEYDEEYKKVRRGEKARNLQNTFWSVDGVEIGGIVDYLLPEGASMANSDWLHEIDLPEWKEENLGRFGGSSQYGVWELEFFTDVPPGTEIDPVQRRHIFFVDYEEERIYDMWFDLLTVDPDVMEAILKSANIGEALPVEISDEEKAAQEKCRDVLQALQSGSYQIVTENRCDTPEKIHSYTTEYWRSGENWLEIRSLPVGESFEKHAAMYADGKTYSNYGNWSGEEILWHEQKIDSPELPWCVQYQWNENTVSYIDTLQEDTHQIIMLEIREPFPYFPGETERYHASFRFDQRGALLNIRLQAFVTRNDEIWTAYTTESIVSLDPDTVWAEMAEEVRRATGKEVVRGENVTTDTLLYQSEDGTQAVVISTDKTGSTVFRSESQIIGGIASYLIPEGVYDPEDESWQWLKEVGIPDYEDGTLMDEYINFRNTGAWSVTFSRDEAPAVRRDHTFYVKDGHVIDLWFDMLRIDHDFSMALRDAAKAAYGLTETPVQEIPVIEDATLYLKTFESSDGTVKVNINTWIPNALENHGLSIEKLTSVIEQKLRSKSVDGYGLDTTAMGYEGVHCEVRITDIKPGSDYLVAANTAVPTIEVWGTRTYVFANADRLGDEEGAIQLLLLNAKDGTILISFGEKN